mmetsp:Transcript_5219/g.7865  ORF Transcript_5219/g.7865 Transcript_5219/m.7865 type:complete len:176 (+) Transcript_5219:145-672(+)|eukprot:CAMPEP_0196142210 /NCGR_PEP_ID=MMETSP0910-20130528/11318_1 /TAXON_ID=49265 /ORGANISM="Thalassiosira rotula, Strain GSO102" /LENGTH=175 /DNA_ID=CAMNT_0041403495 /DNA_START=125 /DNA_END=652 /DNA_ORIENTATION=+
MINKHSLIAAILWICLFCQEGSAFLIPAQHHSLAITPKSMVQLSAHHNDDGKSAFLGSRREWTKNIISSLVATGSVAILASSEPQQALAADAGGDTIWKTGKAPKVPGQKPKDKGDTKGTKKDPAFLRSISDCRSKCENSPGPDGLAKTSTECLAECQDICCTTYEQCTFAIVPR